MIEFSAILTLSASLEAVKRNGYALRYVKDQTEAVVLEAVKRNGDALQYVLEKPLFIKIAAMLKILINIKDPTAKAVKAYAAYCKQAGGITFDGKPLPTFEQLGEERQSCWIAVADTFTA
jgi:hypothetical protein